MTYDHMAAVGNGGEQTDAYSDDVLDEILGLAGHLQDLLPHDAVVIDLDMGHTSFEVTHIDRSIHPAQTVFTTDDLAELRRYVAEQDELGTSEGVPPSLSGPSIGQFTGEPNTSGAYELSDPKHPEWAERHGL